MGLECTIGVENIDIVLEKVQEHGGKILMSKTEIPEVGLDNLIFGYLG